MTDGPYRVLLAPNAFKGSFSSVRVAAIWERALRKVPGVETLSRPLSDGGDGSLEVWETLLEAAAVEPRRVWFVARDPLGQARKVATLWASDRREGFVETALASGLALVPPERRDPLVSTTRGSGQLLLGLLQMGAREVTLGLGGSATCDGGLGLGQALGFRFQDAGGAEIANPSELPRLAHVVTPAERPWETARVRALCDVRNPLLGPSGAARVFGPQKFPPGDHGLARGVELLERGLERLAEVVAADLGVELAGPPAFGAAGGLGAGLAAFAGAVLESGSRYFLAAAGISELLAAQPRLDAVLTGEGSYDAQSAEGKVAGELLALCEKAGVPLWILAGRADSGVAGRVLTGHAIGAGDSLLDEAALGALAVEAVRQLGVAAPRGRA